MPPRHSRSSSPTPWPNAEFRAVHRRIQMPEDDDKANIKALIEQSSMDRDYMGKLAEALKNTMDRVVEQGREVN